MNVLILSPHTDDAEIGAGGYIAKLVEEGHRVSCVTFSRGEPRTGANETEFVAAMKILGVNDYFLLNYPAMHFPDVRQKILQEIEEANKRSEPDLVICPSLVDTHQDHNTVAKEAVRAFKKKATLMCYEFPPNEVYPTFAPNCYIKLERKHLDKKAEALAIYRSQEWRIYMTEQYVFCLAYLRGMQIGVRYAEAFEVVRSIA